MTYARRVLTAVTLVALTVPAVAQAGSAGKTYTKARNGGTGMNATAQGWYADEAALDPVTVASGGMKVAWKAKVDGEIYGQPVQAGGRVIVATEANHVASIDAHTGKVQWDVKMPTPWSPAVLKLKSGQSCPDLVPTVGATSTPVLDPSGQVIYVVAKQQDDKNHALAHIVMHAIRVADGKQAWQTEIQGYADNIRGAHFNPTTANPRAGLLFLDGRIYFAAAGHCDIGPYRGWVVGVDARSHRITSKWTAASHDGIEADSSGGNGIWMGGGALTSDGPGRIYISVGNGPTPASGTDVDPGTVTDWGDSVVRLAVQGNGKLKAVDFFTPRIADKLNVSDSDLGSSGITLLPDSFGTRQHPHLAILYDKESRVFLVDRDDLGKRGTRTDTNLQSLGPFTYGAKGQLAAYGNDGGLIYYADNFGLRAFASVGETIDGAPSLAQVGSSGPEAHIGVAPGQGSPVVTSDGGRDGTGVVWVVGRNPGAHLFGHLMAFQSEPISGRLKLIYRSPDFQGTKFARPLPVDGKIVVGQYDGQVVAYAPAKPFAGPNFRPTDVDFASTPVGSSVTKRIDLLPRRGKGGGIRSLSISGGDFSVKRVTGDILDLTFAPTLQGTSTGSLNVVTLGGPEQFPLTGFGQPAGAAGVSLSPSTLSFLPTVAGEFLEQSVSILNDTDAPIALTSVTLPAPFTTVAPTPGISIPAQGSLIVPVTFTPVDRVQYTGTLSVQTAAGTATSTLSGAGTGPGHTVLSASQLTYGSVKVGRSKTLTLTITNNGEGTIHLDKAKEPTGDFKDPRPIYEGATILPGGQLVQKITFTPTGTGTRKSAYTITADDNQGVQTIPLVGTGTR